MKNVIQITDKILGVIVPSDAHGFFLLKPKQFGNKSKSKFALNMYIPRTKLSMSKFNFSDYTCTLNIDCNNLKIHGTCTLPDFDFDFEPTMGKEELTALIQKAIQDEGMFVVNPYGENRPQELVDYTGRKDGIIANSLDIEKWQSAESKTVKKLLLIEKI